MTIQKVCASELYNIGSMSCKENNPFLDAVSLIFTQPEFEFADGAAFAAEAGYLTGIKAKNVIPLHDIVEIDDNSEDPQYYEAPNGSRIPRRFGKYRHVYKFNKGLEVHKALQSYTNAKLKVFIIDDAGNVCGYSPDGTKVTGMDIGMINAEKMSQAGQDNTPAWTPVAIDMKDAKQWNEKGVFVNPTWDAVDLAAVSDVEVSVVSAIATLIVLRVAYNNGFSADGSDDLVGIAGIVEDDFVFVTTTPTGSGAMIDNGDGTYDHPGTGMTAGSVDLKSPATAASTGDPIESTGPAVITI
ncbi:MAG: hypothetical protein KAS32_12345 [Candidatus Peribacteraceae bacterium]|nr:hypothetical protein [Candidatus Peribacteraceae bacterium]